MHQSFSAENAQLFRCRNQDRKCPGSKACPEVESTAPLLAVCAEFTRGVSSLRLRLRVTETGTKKRAVCEVAHIRRLADGGRFREMSSARGERRLGLVGNSNAPWRNKPCNLTPSQEEIIMPKTLRFFLLCSVLAVPFLGSSNAHAFTITNRLEQCLQPSLHRQLFPDVELGRY
jgi:hypothetical protein